MALKSLPMEIIWRILDFVDEPYFSDTFLPWIFPSYLRHRAITLLRFSPSVTETEVVRVFGLMNEIRRVHRISTDSNFFPFINRFFGQAVVFSNVINPTTGKGVAFVGQIQWNLAAPNRDTLTYVMEKCFLYAVHTRDRSFLLTLALSPNLVQVLLPLAPVETWWRLIVDAVTTLAVFFYPRVVKHGGSAGVLFWQTMLMNHVKKLLVKTNLRRHADSFPFCFNRTVLNHWMTTQPDFCRRVLFPPYRPGYGENTVAVGLGVLFFVLTREFLLLRRETGNDLKISDVVMMSHVISHPDDPSSWNLFEMTEQDLQRGRLFSERLARLSSGEQPYVMFQICATDRRLVMEHLDTYTDMSRFSLTRIETRVPSLEGWWKIIHGLVCMKWTKFLRGQFHDTPHRWVRAMEDDVGAVELADELCFRDAFHFV